MEIEQRAAQVARARAHLAKVTKDAEAFEARLQGVKEGISRAEKRRDEALAGLRCGDLQEDIGAARLAVAKADAVDLAGIATGIRQELANAESLRDAAAEALKSAEEWLSQGERDLMILGLDAQIMRLQDTLCRAIAERYRLGVDINGGRSMMLSQIWRPSKPLDDAVRFQVPPRVVCA